MRVFRIIVVIVFAACLGLYAGTGIREKLQNQSEEPKLYARQEILELSTEDPPEKMLEGLTASDAEDGDLTDSIGYNIFFENNVTFQEKYRFRNRLTLDAEELEKCESIFSQMLREQTIRSSGCRAMNEALFMELCVLICRAFSRAERKSLSEISNLSRLLEFMKRHYMEELPLPELARRGHCSVSSLCRLFRSALGRSPGEYLNTLRLERAAKELRETEKSISAIAFSCGFQDSNYFSFRFSRHFGCSPREYRRMCSGERPDRPR